MLGLYKLIASDAMYDEEFKQKRTHKKRRINKKWLKRYGTIYLRKPKREVFIFEDRIIGHPETIKKIREHSQQS